MVVLHVRSAEPAPPPDGDEGTEFLYECPAASSVADVAAALGALAGLQARLLSLCRRLRARCADARDAGELERALDEAEAYASKEQAQRNRFLSPRALREHIKNIEKKCATALQEPPEALSLQESPSDSKHERIQLWWAGKELAMDQKLCDYIGVNDKTKGDDAEFDSGTGIQITPYFTDRFSSCPRIRTVCPEFTGEIQIWREIKAQKGKPPRA